MIPRSSLLRSAHTGLLKSNSSISRRSLNPIFLTTNFRSFSTPSDLLSSLGIDNSKEIPGVFDGVRWGGEGKVMESLNPATGKVLGKVRTASESDLSQTLSNARTAQSHWKHVPAPQRGMVLQQIREKIVEKKDELGELVSLEMGKIGTEGKGEVQEIIDICDLAIGLSRTMNGRVLNSERPGHWMMEIPNPLGVVGVITAHNFPVAVLGWNLALSLVAGNSTIWSPSPTTPLCSIALSRLIASVLTTSPIPNPGGIVPLLTGGPLVGNFLTNSPSVDMISFTGSEKTGREVGKTVQGRFGKVLLELGGNNAAVVMEDADLKMAIPTVVFSSLGTCGQRCTSTRRLLIHEKVEGKFLEGLKKGYEGILKNKVGDPNVEGVLLGPMHSKEGKERFLKAVEECKKQGGEILIGGDESVSSSVTTQDSSLSGGNWVTPTVVYWGSKKAVEQGKSIIGKETFGPLLHVIRVGGLDEAIEINNSVGQGLSSSLFTEDVRKVFKWIGEGGSDTGIVNVNQSTSGAEIGAAFGGNKATGWGRESGGDAWKQYVRWSSCTINYSGEVAMAQGVKFD